jgi:hypothetical protein
MLSLYYNITAYDLSTQRIVYRIAGSLYIFNNTKKGGRRHQEEEEDEGDDTLGLS